MLSAEQFIGLVQPRHHHRACLPDWIGCRGIATCFLAYCCGLWFPEIAALRRADWLRGGLAAIRITGLRTERRQPALATRPRCIPVPPAAKWAVGEYLERAPEQSEGLFCFDTADVDRGRTLKNQVTFALRRSGLVDDGIRAGALRSSFEARVRQRDGGDGLTDYLIGKVADMDTVDAWVDRTPPLQLLRNLLERASPIWKVERRFWREGA